MLGSKLADALWVSGTGQAAGSVWGLYVQWPMSFYVLYSRSAGHPHAVVNYG